ncbi:ATP-binding protein [Nostoc ellipsosporum NOK]|nr:ATP-binding protein [Nostoc ellipsosporum NOK]
MDRPLFNESIVKLQASFEAHKTDHAFLKLLKEELSFRTTERAKRLNILVTELLQVSLSKNQTEQSSPDPSPVKAFPTYSLADYKTSNANIDMNISLSNKAADIFSSWIALEVLSPQTFSKPQDLATGMYGSIASLDKALPWEGEGEKSKPNYRLFYQIVLGTIEFPKAVSALLDIYADKRIERPVPKGEAVLAIAVVDNKGLLVESPSIAVSSFAWGVPQALKGDLSKLKEWATAEKLMTEELDKLMRRTDIDGNELPIDKNSLNLAKNFLVSKLELPIELVTSNRFAIRSYEYFTNPEPPDPILLNSFYLGDLITAGKLFESKQATGNLQRYLGVTKPATRKNLLLNRETLESAIAPSSMLPSRWPGLGRHPLVVLQQAAVNLALNELRVDGILAVNGPPGTGKTTLLRDIVAGLVTKRAQAMLAFDNPEDAFSDSSEKLKVGQASLRLYKIDSGLKGFEMLITSSNNKAVENVSAELPVLTAIANDATDLRYFTSLSDALLKRDSWGLIAAVLGNALNRSHFRQKFWWDKEVGFSTYLAEAAGTPQFVDVIDEKTGKVIGTRKPRIVEEENPPSNPEIAKERWNIAKKKFQSALKESQNKLSVLEQVRQTVLSLESLEQAKISAIASLKQAQTDEEFSKSNFEASVISDADCKASFKQLETEFLKHRRLRPHLFARFFRTAYFRQWKNEHDAHKTKVIAAKKELEDSSAKFSQNEAIHKKSIARVQTCEQSSQKASEKLAKAQEKITNARKMLGDHLIDMHFFRLPHEEKHLISPWCDKEAQRLRDNVFIAAIQLHKAFIDAAAKPLKHNLGALMSAFSGRKMTDVEKTGLVPDLWSTLFIVVPCVSTTFASVERMLGKIPPESLGWLLIDEAGQALPQAAIGALMRTKRAVIVGDPIQIEPVVVLPDTLTQNICRRFGVNPDHFNAPEASAQTLADSATPYFAEFESQQGSRTVGVPLLVHRRCEDPMFGVSNTIAYERLMVQAKKSAKSAIRDCLGASAWIDIHGQGQEKWCPEEGEVVLNLLHRLKAEKITPDLYIVTPFVIVANNLRRVIFNSGILSSWVDDPIKWPYERIGTVHTVQGREAEAVIFVLGATLPQQTGARGWAGGRPNLLNVAVSRAKEVLYVVGNRQLWREAGVFRELSNRLP